MRSIYSTLGYQPLGLLENMSSHCRELDMGKDSISGGLVGIVEKDSIRDGKRGSGGIEVHLWQSE